MEMIVVQFFAYCFLLFLLLLVCSATELYLMQICTEMSIRGSITFPPAVILAGMFKVFCYGSVAFAVQVMIDNDVTEYDG